MFNKNKVALGICALIVLGLILVFNRSDRNPNSNTVKIGVIAPLEGGAAVFGESLVKGIQMAQVDLKDRTGTKYKYEIIVEDDGSTAAKAASAAQKLIYVDKVDAVITTTSVTGNAAKPVALAAKVPHICVCSDITIANAEYNFTNSIPPKG